MKLLRRAVEVAKVLQVLAQVLGSVVVQVLKGSLVPVLVKLLILAEVWEPARLLLAEEWVLQHPFLVGV